MFHGAAIHAIPPRAVLTVPDSPETISRGMPVPRPSRIILVSVVTVCVRRGHSTFRMILLDMGQEKKKRDVYRHINTLTLVTLILGYLLGDVLYLQQQLDSLDGRDGGLGNRRGHTASDKILCERHGIRETRHREVLGACVCR